MDFTHAIGWVDRKYRMQKEDILSDSLCQLVCCVVDEDDVRVSTSTVALGQSLFLALALNISPPPVMVSEETTGGEPEKSAPGKN